MRMVVVSAAALAAVLVLAAPVPPAGARIDPCERACRVVFERGGSNCQKKVKNGIKTRQRQCKTDFASSGFPSVQKCRTAARKFGLAIIRASCRTARADACRACCTAGGSKETCAPRSPSGAFVTLDGPLV